MWNKPFMRVGSASMSQSALQLMQEAFARSAEAAQTLASGSLDAHVDGAMALRAAAQSAEIAAALSRTSQALDEALLDILA
jgi:hypothetical protein